MAAQYSAVVASEIGFRLEYFQAFKLSHSTKMLPPTLALLGLAGLYLLFHIIFSGNISVLFCEYGIPAWLLTVPRAMYLAQGFLIALAGGLQRA
jgi:hypothetical protein